MSKSEPHSQTKARVKKTREKSKGTCQRTKSAEGSCKGGTSKTGISGLDNLKSETCSETQESAQMGHVCTTGTSWIHDEWNDGLSLDEWNDDLSSVGRHEDCEQTYDTAVCSFSLEGLDLGAKSSPKRFEWVEMNLDTGAAVNTFPLNCSPEGKGDGRFYDWIPDGEAWQFQGYDENGLPRSLSGRLKDAHQVLCSAAEIACKKQQYFFLGHDGGYMIPVSSNIGQGMRMHFEKLLNEY